MYVSQSIICIYLCLFVFKWKNVRFPKVDFASILLSLGWKQMKGGQNNIVEL